jgi:hypothetical protein
LPRRPLLGGECTRPQIGFGIGIDVSDAEQMDALGAAILATGISASEVADRVFDAIVEERLYILTHEETAPAVQNRMTSILESRNPEPLLFPPGSSSFIDPV